MMPFGRAKVSLSAARRWGRGVSLASMALALAAGFPSAAAALNFAYPTDGSHAFFGHSAAVSGTLRIANGGEVCDGDLTGAIRYNSGVFEFCGGSSWQSLADLAGGGAPDAIVSGTTRVTANTGGTISLTTGGTTRRHDTKVMNLSDI